MNAKGKVARQNPTLDNVKLYNTVLRVGAGLLTSIFAYRYLTPRRVYNSCYVMLAGPARPLVPAAKCFVLTPASVARMYGFSCGRLYSACCLPVSRSRDFLQAEAMCAFCIAGVCKKPLRRPWFFSSFARYRAGSEPCRSGSVIGANPGCVSGANDAERR